MAGKFNFSAIFQAVDKITKPVKRMTDSVEGLTKKAKKIGSIGAFDKLKTKLSIVGAEVRNLRSKFGRLGGAIVALGSGAALVGFVRMARGVADAGDKIAKTADKLGVGIEALQEWRFAAERSGVSTETFDKSLEKFVINTGRAVAGTGEQAKAFAALGINLKDSNGKLKSTEQLMTETADALDKIEDPTLKAQAAYVLFGREGVALTNMMKGGAAGLAQLRQEARDTGSIMSEKLARDSETANDRLLEFNLALKGLSQTLVAELIPAVTPLISDMTKWIVANKDLIVTGIKVTASVIAGVAAIWTAVKAFTALKVIIGIVNVLLAINPFILLAMALATAAVAIYVYWDDIADFISDTVDRISSFFTGLWNGLVEPLKQVWNTIINTIPAPIRWLMNQAGVDISFDTSSSLNAGAISAANQPAQKGEVKVRFENAPAGLRVQSIKGDNALGVSTETQHNLGDSLLIGAP